MKYVIDADSMLIARDIISKLGFDHIPLERIVFIRSTGSKSRRILARIQGLSKIMQKAMGVDAFYAIEIITENFDRLSDDEKVKTILHELMHIPHCFGGGFRQHKNYVNKRTVESAYREYRKC